jgi:hypothetical protein
MAYFFNDGGDYTDKDVLEDMKKDGLGQPFAEPPKAVKTFYDEFAEGKDINIPVAELVKQADAREAKAMQEDVITW